MSIKTETNTYGHVDSHGVYRVGDTRVMLDSVVAAIHQGHSPETSARCGNVRSPMSYMFEVYYKPPTNAAKETAVMSRVAALGGRLDYREEATEHSGVCLTFEFDDLEKAARAAQTLRQLGEHVEEPMDYAV